jgi:hypothetical protein
MPAGYSLAERQEFDLRVLAGMRCETFTFEGYRTTPDLESRRRASYGPDAGAGVTRYRWTFRVPTHISRYELAPVTEIGVSTDVDDYPRVPPQTWIISSHVPWSPHFRKGAPVCIGGELWQPTGGHITLGELVINIAHLLNWDEKGRGAGYVGWNGAAIDYHKSHYGGRPINPGLRYPVLPGWLSGDAPPTPSFQVSDRTRPAEPGFLVL